MRRRARKGGRTAVLFTRDWLFRSANSVIVIASSGTVEDEDESEGGPNTRAHSKRDTTTDDSVPMATQRGESITRTLEGNTPVRRERERRICAGTQ